MQNEKFEEWFDVAFQSAASTTSLTSEESKKASWEKVKSRLERMDRARIRKRRLQLTGMVVASFIAGAILFSPPGMTQAVSPLINSMVDFGNGIVNIFVKNGEVPQTAVPSNTSPPPDAEQNTKKSAPESAVTAQSVSISKSELNQKLSFEVPSFQQIPQRFHLKDTLISNPNEISDKVTFKYEDNQQKLMWIVIKKLKLYESFGAPATKQTELVKLENGYEAYYSSSETQGELQLTYNGLLIRITGDLTQNELFSIAESLPHSNGE